MSNTFLQKNYFGVQAFIKITIKIRKNIAKLEKS